MRHIHNSKRKTEREMIHKDCRAEEVSLKSVFPRHNDGKFSFPRTLSQLVGEKLCSSSLLNGKASSLQQLCNSSVSLDCFTSFTLSCSSSSKGLLPLSLLTDQPAANVTISKSRLTDFLKLHCVSSSSFAPLSSLLTRAPFYVDWPTNYSAYL